MSRKCVVQILLGTTLHSASELCLVEADAGSPSAVLGYPVPTQDTMSAHICVLTFKSKCSWKAVLMRSLAVCRALYVIHAHTYFPYSTQAEQQKANEFFAAFKARFVDKSGVKFDDINTRSGDAWPHPLPQFEAAFIKAHVADILPWLMFNRPDGFSVLLHPFTAQLVSAASCQWLHLANDYTKYATDHDANLLRGLRHLVHSASSII